MAKLRAFTCEKCGKPAEVKEGHSFLGFPKTVCPSCGHTNLFQLSSGYRTFYIIWMVLVGLFLIVNLAAGRVGVPGVLAIAGMIALIKDNKLRRGGSLNMPVDTKTDHAESKDEKVAKANEDQGEHGKFCGNCGAKLDGDAKFCEACGTKI